MSFVCFLWACSFCRYFISVSFSFGLCFFKARAKNTLVFRRLWSHLELVAIRRPRGKVWIQISLKYRNLLHPKANCGKKKIWSAQVNRWNVHYGQGHMVVIFTSKLHYCTPWILVILFHITQESLTSSKKEGHTAEKSSDTSFFETLTLTHPWGDSRR